MVAVLTVAMGRPAMGVDTEYSRATLKGIEGMQVLVEDFTEGEKNAGFDSRIFQTDVELKLRLAGIKVLTSAERLTTPGTPYLYLNVNPLDSKTRNPPFSYSIGLEFYQVVLLARDPDISAHATTWSVGSIGNGALPYIRDWVKDHMDQFINAWLSVNR